MDWELDYLESAGVLRIRIRRRLSLDSANELTRAAVAQLKARGCQRVLVDHRTAPLGFAMTEIYERPRLYERLGLSRRARIALVFGALDEKARFWEDVAQNQGFDLRVFADLETAQGWLGENPPPGA